MFSAASCAGVAAVFGAPFGGVLFAIETISNFYMTSFYWRGVFCAIFSSLTFYVTRQLGFTVGMLNIKANMFHQVKTMPTCDCCKSSLTHCHIAFLNICSLYFWVLLPV